MAKHYAGGSESLREFGENSIGRNPFVSGKEHTVIVDTSSLARISTSERVRGVLVLDSDVKCSASIYRRHKGFIDVRFTREPEFLQRVDVTSNTTTVNFDDIHGDYDNDYELEGLWLCPTGTATPKLHWDVNGSTTSLLSSGSHVDLSSGPTTEAGLLLASAVKKGTGEDLQAYLHAHLHAATGVTRFGYSECVVSTSATSAETDSSFIGYKWEDISTTVTSLGITSDSANQIGAGSWFELSRIREFNKTKITLWVY